jgi:hypothetical protein
VPSMARPRDCRRHSRVPSSIALRRSAMSARALKGSTI